MDFQELVCPCLPKIAHFSLAVTHVHSTIPIYKQISPVHEKIKTHPPSHIRTGCSFIRTLRSFILFYFILFHFFFLAKGSLIYKNICPKNRENTILLHAFHMYSCSCLEADQHMSFSC